MQKKFGQHIILLIYSSIWELKFPDPFLNFWAWHCLFDLVGVALKTMEISSQTQQLHCTVVQKCKIILILPAFLVMGYKVLKLLDKTFVKSMIKMHWIPQKEMSLDKKIIWHFCSFLVQMIEIL